MIMRKVIKPMTSEQFIKAMKLINNSGIAGLMEFIDHPPGRSPSKTVLNVSDFFHRLNAEEQKIFRDALNMASEKAYYSFLLMLDGLRAFEPAGPKGKLELIYHNADGTEHIVLNDPNADFLSTLFKSED